MKKKGYAQSPKCGLHLVTQTSVHIPPMFHLLIVDLILIVDPLMSNFDPSGILKKITNVEKLGKSQHATPALRNTATFCCVQMLITPLF